MPHSFLCASSCRRKAKLPTGISAQKYIYAAGVAMATTLLHTPSRASTSSGSSYVPLTRQNTMSSQDGTRSMRASKRYSVTALYLSMNANQRDLEIEDDLARGM